MSLVVVKKDGNQLCIVSDTQLTYPDQSSKRNKTHPIDGSLKTILLSTDLAVSFAGDIKFADQAIKAIGALQDVLQILQILQTFHQKSEEETEFILTKCYADSPPQIYKIANGNCSEEESAWMGDLEAFSLFQSYVLHKPLLQKPAGKKVASTAPQLNEPIIKNFKFAIERKVKSNIFSKLSAGMDWVIDSNISPTVGGFKVVALFDKSFRYVSYSRSFNERLEFNERNQFKFHASAAHGGYSIIFHGASRNYNVVALYVLQGGFGVVYERQDNGLHRPNIIRTDEPGFHSFLAKNYGIEGVFPNSYAAERYFPEMWTAYEAKDWNKTLTLLDQAILNNHGKLKAGLLFNKGIACLHLNKHNTAMASFFEALALNHLLYSKFRKALNQWRIDLDRSFGLKR